MKFFSDKKLPGKGKDRPRPVSDRNALRGGGYSLTLTAIVLAILIVVNVFAGVLPANLTKIDISSSRLYSITSNTKVVVNALTEDVTIYWIVQSDKEDSIVENLLEKYESLSGHISVVKKNPDVFPTFAAQYTDEQVSNNSLVVECGEKSRYISYESLYPSDIDYTTYSQVYSFDGEGAITSAIDYVTGDTLPRIYALTGHGEEDLPESVTQQIERENMELDTVSLLKEDTVPEDAACVLLYAPQSDLSEKEAQILADYVSDGGKLLVFAGPVESGTLQNLNSILDNYGVTVEEGIVVEGDRGHYAFQEPYILLPDIQSSDITDSLIDENYLTIVPVAQGLTTASLRGNTEAADAASGTSSDTDTALETETEDTAEVDLYEDEEEDAAYDALSNGQVTELLVTSSLAYSKKAGYSIETYEKEEGDTDGPFALAVSIDDYSGGQIVWVSSSDFLEDTFNSYSSGANLDFAMNALSMLVGETEATAIRSKSLGYNYLTISDTAASMLKTLMIFLLPLTFLLTGILITLKRRNMGRAASDERPGHL